MKQKVEKVFKRRGGSVSYPVSPGGTRSLVVSTIGKNGNSGSDAAANGGLPSVPALSPSNHGNNGINHKFWNGSSMRRYISLNDNSSSTGNTSPMSSISSGQRRSRGPRQSKRFGFPFMIALGNACFFILFIAIYDQPQHKVDNKRKEVPMPPPPPPTERKPGNGLVLEDTLEKMLHEESQHPIISASTTTTTSDQLQHIIQKAPQQQLEQNSAEQNHISQIQSAEEPTRMYSLGEEHQQLDDTIDLIDGLTRQQQEIQQQMQEIQRMQQPPIRYPETPPTHQDLTEEGQLQLQRQQEAPPPIDSEVSHVSIAGRNIPEEIDPATPPDPELDNDQLELENIVGITVSANQTHQHMRHQEPVLAKQVLKLNSTKSTTLPASDKQHNNDGDGKVEAVVPQPTGTNDNKTVSGPVFLFDTDEVMPPSPFAYVFMAWKINPDKERYLPYIANILIASKILRKHGSQADIVAVFKLVHKTPHNKLPSHVEDMLLKANIQIIYLPKDTERESKRNVWSTMLYKFELFNLTQYQRVTYLDSDVLPLNNLDYLFQMSMQGILKETVVIASCREPSNGGLFMITPDTETYRDIHHIIESKKANIIAEKQLFDATHGWGHVIHPPDLWETNWPDYNGTKWDFWGAFADQGLLYHYPKYVQKSLTQVLSYKVVNFGPNPNTTDSTLHPASIEEQWTVKKVSDSPFYNFSSRQYDFRPLSCAKVTGKQKWENSRFQTTLNITWPSCPPPFSDFTHFMGASKPWTQPVPETFFKQLTIRENHSHIHDVAPDLPGTETEKAHGVVELWWHILAELHNFDDIDIFRLGLNITKPGGDGSTSGGGGDGGSLVVTIKKKEQEQQQHLSQNNSNKSTE